MDWILVFDNYGCIIISYQQHRSQPRMPIMRPHPLLITILYQIVIAGFTFTAWAWRPREVAGTGWWWFVTVFILHGMIYWWYGCIQLVWLDTALTLASYFHAKPTVLNSRLQQSFAVSPSHFIVILTSITGTSAGIVGLRFNGWAPFPHLSIVKDRFMPIKCSLGDHLVSVDMKVQLVHALSEHARSNHGCWQVQSEENSELP